MPWSRGNHVTTMIYPHNIDTYHQRSLFEWKEEHGMCGRGNNDDKTQGIQFYCILFEDDLYIKLYKNIQITMTQIMDFFFTK